MARDHARIHLDIENPSLRRGGSSRRWLLAHMPRLVYSGQIGRRANWRMLPHQIEGIYHLFDSDGELVYIGKTCNPFQRFVRHREKSGWWGQVTWINHYVITCDDHLAEPCPRRSLKHAAFRWELSAISHLRPPNNIAGVPA